MNVGDVMNLNAIRVRQDATIREAVGIISSMQVSDLAVVDEENQFVGVLSEGDLIRAALPNYEEILGSETGMQGSFELFLEKGRELGEKAIAPHVITKPITVSTADPVLKAATTLISKQIRRLPVVDGKKLMGSISRGDICRAMVGG